MDKIGTRPLDPVNNLETIQKFTPTGCQFSSARGHQLNLASSEQTFDEFQSEKWPKCETKIPKFHKKSAPHTHTEGTTIEKKSVPTSQNVEKRGRNTSERTSIFIGTVRFGPQSAPDQVTDLVWTEAQVVGGQGRCGGGGSGSSGGCHRQNVATFQVKSASDEETNKQINKPTK